MDGAAQLLGYHTKLDLYGASIKFSKRSQKKILQLAVNCMNIGIFVHKRNRKSIFVCDIDRCVSCHEEVGTKTVFEFNAITKLALQRAIDSSDVYFEPAEEDTGYFVCTGFDILQQVGIPPSLRNVSNHSIDTLKMVDVKHLNIAGLKFLGEIRVFKEKRLPLIDLCEDDIPMIFSESQLSLSDSLESLSVSCSESPPLDLWELKSVGSSAVTNMDGSPVAVVSKRKKKSSKCCDSLNIRNRKRKLLCVDGPASTVIRNRKKRKLNATSLSINGPASTVIRNRKKRKLNATSLNINGPASTVIRNRKKRKLNATSLSINGPASTVIRNRKTRKLNREKKQKRNSLEFINSAENFLKNNPKAVADAIEFLKYSDPDEYFPDDAVGVYVSIYGEFWVKFRLFAESSKDLRENEKPRYLKEPSLEKVKDEDGSQYSDPLKDEIIDFIIKYHVSIL